MVEIHFQKVGGTLVVEEFADAEVFAAVLGAWIDANGTELPYDQEAGEPWH